jgi:hypothetical protein
MSKFKFSKGPWHKCNANDGNCSCGLIWDSEGTFAIAEPIARVTSSCREHEGSNLCEGLIRGGVTFMANARLISCCPELLDVVISAYKEHTTGKRELDAGDLKELIEKATGVKIYEAINS